VLVDYGVEFDYLKKAPVYHHVNCLLFDGEVEKLAKAIIRVKEKS